MTMNDQHERLFRAFLDDDALGNAPPDLLSRALSRTAVARRRPQWYARVREDVLGLSTPAAGGARVRVGVVVGVAILLIALVAGFAFVGSRLLRPHLVIDLLTYSTLAETDSGGRMVMYVVESGDGGTKLVGAPLEGGSCGQFSPDGAHLAYQILPGVGGTSRYQIVVADADGGHAGPIGNADVRTRSWQWSGDGSRIFSSTTLPDRLAFMSIPVDGAQRIELVALRGALGAVWSPDGHRVAVMRPNAGEGQPWTELTILVGDADGSNLQPVTTFPDPYESLGHSVDWSPDERFLVYHRYPTGAVFPSDVSRAPAWDLFAVGVDGSDDHALTSTPEVFEGNVAWSPDSRRIAYSGAGLRMTTLDGRTTTVLAPTAGALAWLQDGSSIAFVRPGERGSTDTIAVVRADGTEAPAEMVAMPDSAAHVDCLDVRPEAR